MEEEEEASGTDEKRWGLKVGREQGRRWWWREKERERRREREARIVEQ